MSSNHSTTFTSLTKAREQKWSLSIQELSIAVLFDRWNTSLATSVLHFTFSITILSHLSFQSFDDRPRQRRVFQAEWQIRVTAVSLVLDDETTFFHRFWKKLKADVDLSTGNKQMGDLTLCALSAPCVCHCSLLQHAELVDWGKRVWSDR